MTDAEAIWYTVSTFIFFVVVVGILIVIYRKEGD